MARSTRIGPTEEYEIIESNWNTLIAVDANRLLQSGTVAEFIDNLSSLKDSIAKKNDAILKLYMVHRPQDGLG